MNARYNRISTITQNIERQVAKTQLNEQLYNDVISGSVPFAERPQGLKLIQDIKEDKIKYVTVSSIDRLGRNTLDILQTIELFNESGVNLRVDNLGIESMTKGKPNQVFKLIISVMSNVSEMEREAILERQREGIAIAKLKGTYNGRVKGSKEDDKTILNKYNNVIKSLKKGHSLRDTAKLNNISLGTVQKVKRIYLKSNSL